MNSDKYQICTRCVMDTSDPGISFNSKGECNHCSDFLKTRIQYKYNGKKSDAILDGIISQIKNKSKNRKYDCVIGISGGIDSCYAAYILQKKGLKILAVHLDNGWN